MRLPVRLRILSLLLASVVAFAPMLAPAIRARTDAAAMHAVPPAQLSRRGALLAALPLLLSTAKPVLAKDGPPFDGAYTDPKHPGCPRNIALVDDSNVDITGQDGTPGCTADGPTKAWRLAGKVKGDQIFVDFSPKGGPKNLLGKWEEDGIRWPDSNKWTKASGSVPSSL